MILTLSVDMEFKPNIKEEKLGRSNLELKQNEWDLASNSQCPVGNEQSCKSSLGEGIGSRWKAAASCQELPLSFCF